MEGPVGQGRCEDGRRTGQGRGDDRRMRRLGQCGLPSQATDDDGGADSGTSTSHSPASAFDGRTSTASHLVVYAFGTRQAGHTGARGGLNKKTVGFVQELQGEIGDRPLGCVMEAEVVSATIQDLHQGRLHEAPANGWHWGVARRLLAILVIMTSATPATSAPCSGPARSTMQWMVHGAVRRRPGCGQSWSWRMTRRHTGNWPSSFATELVEETRMGRVVSPTRFAAGWNNSTTALLGIRGADRLVATILR